MISTKKMLEIIKTVLEDNSGQIQIRLGHYLKDDLRLCDKDIKNVVKDLKTVFKENNCDLDLDDISDCETVNDLCGLVVENITDLYL